MSDSKEQDKPSMEEILASIRKIISEEDKKLLTDEDESVAQDDAKVEKAAAEEGEAEEEILELTQMLDGDGSVVDLTETPAEEAPEEAPRKMAEEEAPPATDELELVAEEKEEKPEPEPEPEPEPLPPMEPEEPLISPPVAATSTEAFAKLADALVREKLFEGRTVEHLIKEILRPLLKQWLDDNLTGLVERLVKEEIEKLSERARNLQTGRFHV